MDFRGLRIKLKQKALHKQQSGKYERKNRQKWHFKFVPHFDCFLEKKMSYCESSCDG